MKPGTSACQHAGASSAPNGLDYFHDPGADLQGGDRPSCRVVDVNAGMWWLRGGVVSALTVELAVAKDGPAGFEDHGLHLRDGPPSIACQLPRDALGEQARRTTLPGGVEEVWGRFPTDPTIGCYEIADTGHIIRKIGELMHHCLRSEGCHRGNDPIAVVYVSHDGLGTQIFER